MSRPEVRDLQLTINVDTNTPGFITSPYFGKIVRIFATVGFDLDADCSVAFAIKNPSDAGYTDITGGGITLLGAGSNAGDSYQSNPTADNFIKEGGIWRITPDGVPTTVTGVTFSAKIILPRLHWNP